MKLNTQNEYIDLIKGLYKDAVSHKDKDVCFAKLDTLFRMTANELLAEKTAAASFEHIMEEEFGNEKINEIMERRDRIAQSDIYAMFIDSLKEEAETAVFPEVGNLFECTSLEKEENELDELA